VEVQLPVGTVEEALVSRTMTSMSGSIYKIPLKEQEASYSRDALSKALYGKLFEWLVCRINESLITKTETRSFIGVLDIFGFEHFKTNSFEQLCINFANERLQAHFNSNVFRQEQDIYMREAIAWTPIDEPDNEATIRMLSNRQGQPVGLFPLLDEQCRLPKCTHKTFVEKLFHEHKEAVHDGALAKVGRGSGLAANEGFVVRHYAGEVGYVADGFLQKNNNSLHADLELVLKCASQPFVKQVLDEAAAAEAAAAPPSRARAGSAAKSRSRFSSVSAQFTTQLAELHTTLQATNSSFVRCINPNTTKEADSFVGGHVMHQLRCSGMMEALRLMHAGFPTRCPYDALYERYKDIMPRAVASLDSPSFCEILLMALGLEKADYQLGITKVFFRAGKLAFLDKLTGSEYKELAPDIANRVRVWLIKKRWRRHTIAVVCMLRLTRFLFALRLKRRFYHAAYFAMLMANRPALSLRRARQLRRGHAAVHVQGFGRRLVEMQRLHRKLWALYLVQRVQRGRAVRLIHGGRLAEIRARRREEEEARRAAAAAERTLREQEEVERIKQMARSNAGGGMSAHSAKYTSKSRPKPAAALESGGGEGAAEGGSVAMSAALEARLAKMEEAVAELPALRSRVAALEAELEAATKRLDAYESNAKPPPQPPSEALARRARASSVSEGRASRRSSMSGGAKSWGIFDVLGLTQQPASAQVQPPAVPGAPPASVSSRRASLQPATQRAIDGSSARPNTSLPSEALEVLRKATAALETHFAQEGTRGIAAEVLGNDQSNKEIAVLVRGQLCTALSRVLLHGFKSFKLIGRYHIWDFVQQASISTRERLHKGGASTKSADEQQRERAEQAMAAAVEAVNSLDAGGEGGPVNNPNIKFRSFVCSGLNAGLMHEWIGVMTADEETMNKFYEVWAYVRVRDHAALPEMMAAIKPLSAFRFSLSLDYETSRWDLH